MTIQGASGLLLLNMFQNGQVIDDFIKTVLINNENSCVNKTHIPDIKLRQFYFVTSFLLQMFLHRVPVAQSLETRAVNPGVVSSNPSSANFLSNV